MNDRQIAIARLAGILRLPHKGHKEAFVLHRFGNHYLTGVYEYGESWVDVTAVTYNGLGDQYEVEGDMHSSPHPWGDEDLRLPTCLSATLDPVLDEIIPCALCNKPMWFADSWAPADEAICSECDTEVTARTHSRKTVNPFTAMP